MTSLDPEIAAFVAALNADWQSHPPLDSLTMPDARAVAERVRARWAAGGPPMARTDEHVIETAAGPLRLRLHRPAGVADNLAPALLYLHGGGFVTFSLDTHDRLMREYAAAGGFVVVGIDYPLAPEARYPVALDRIVGLVAWLVDRAASVELDADRLAIGGDSAGANLALATALRLRDEGSPARVRGILSNYGAFSGKVSDAAEAAYGGPAAILNRAEMRDYFERYCGSVDGRGDPYAAPLAAIDLTRLPPIFLVVPECDILSEQSFAMAHRLESAGVEVFSKVYTGTTHSFLEAMSIASIARAAINAGARWVAQRLRR